MTWLRSDWERNNWTYFSSYVGNDREAVKIKIGLKKDLWEWNSQLEKRNIAIKVGFKRKNSSEGHKSRIVKSWLE